MRNKWIQNKWLTRETSADTFLLEHAVLGLQTSVSANLNPDDIYSKNLNKTKSLSKLKDLVKNTYKKFQWSRTILGEFYWIMVIEKA